MKAINITGKHNIDKMNEIGNDSYKSVRKHMINLSETDLLYKTQNDLVRDLYMNIDVKMNLNGCENMDKNTINLKSLFKSELVHKIQGYKGQDIKKEIHNQDTIIKLEDVLEKLDALPGGYLKMIRELKLSKLNNELEKLNSIIPPDYLKKILNKANKIDESEEHLIISEEISDA